MTNGLFPSLDSVILNTVYTSPFFFHFEKLTDLALVQLKVHKNSKKYSYSKKQYYNSEALYLHRQQLQESGLIFTLISSSDEHFYMPLVSFCAITEVTTENYGKASHY